VYLNVNVPGQVRVILEKTQCGTRQNEEEPVRSYPSSREEPTTALPVPSLHPGPLV